MDHDGQRLLDVINDPNALENFLGGSNFNVDTNGITQQQLLNIQHHIQQQQQIQQMQQIQLQQQQSLHSPFSVPSRSPAPGTSPAAMILRSPAPPAASPSPLHASSPAPAVAINSLGAYSVSSPAPAPSPQFYRAAPSPQQQRSGSLSSTPVASPINYPPGPGPGSSASQGQPVLQAGMFIHSAAMGQVQQLVSGGQVLQILPAPPSSVPGSVSMTTANPQQTTVTSAVRPIAAARSKQPQLRPKPANSNPTPAQVSAVSPRAVPPTVQPVPTPTGQVVLGSGGATGTLVLNQMFPALTPTGGQFFLQQQGGSFQLIVRPPVPPSSPPKHQQQPTLVMQQQLAPPTVVSPVLNRPPAAPPPAQQPLVRLVTLPGLGTVQLQQIQTPNGPAFLAVQQQVTSTSTIRATPQPQQFMQQQVVQHHVQQPVQQQLTQHVVQQHIVQQQQVLQHDSVRLASPAVVSEIVTAVSDNSSNSNSTFAAPPKKPAKKKAKKTKKEKEEVVEEKRPPVQVNLGELLKQSGIVDEDDFFFDDDQQPPPAPVALQQPVIEPKENSVVQTVEGEVLSESNLLQTLQQHGLELSADDLHTLRNFIKPADSNDQQPSALGNDISNGLLRNKEDAATETVKAAAPALSLTLGNGPIIQLGDQFTTQPKVQFVTQLDSPGQVFETQRQEAEHVQTNHGFQNVFLEDLARTQIVPDPKKVKAKTLANKTVNNNKKKTEPKRRKSVTKATTQTDPIPPSSADAATTPMLSVVTLPTSQAQQVVTTSAGNATVVQRVHTIKLSPQNQQAQIQYLTSKKDATPQDTSLLQKLIEHHQKILATGKPVPTIPGQHAQGIQFNSAEEAESESVSLASKSIKPIPANIQQNTHLANLLRQPVLDKNPRVTTTSAATQPTTVRYFQPIAGVALQPRPAAPVTSTPVSIQQVVVQPRPMVSVAGTVKVGSNTRSTPVQTSVGTLVLTVVGGATQTTPTVISASSETPPTSITTVTTAVATTLDCQQNVRGIKRPALTAPKSTISKSTLFEHQLKTDQNGALAPDCRTPFKNKSNACKRLVRYHVFHELEPSPAVLEKEESELEQRAEQLLSKFQQMINKYHYLLLMESTKEAPASEYVMVERMFVGEEKQSLERLKEEARVAKELQLTPVWPVKTEPDLKHCDVPEVNPVSLLNGKGAPEDHLPPTAPTNATKTVPKVTLLKFTRKEGEMYKSELQEFKDARGLVEDGAKNISKLRDAIERNSSGTAEKLSNNLEAGATAPVEPKPYDEWEAIQHELALYTDNKEKTDDFKSNTGFTGNDMEEGIIYDEDINAQMQSAIDSILNLNRCDDGPSHSTNSSRNFLLKNNDTEYTLCNGDQYNSSEMQVDLALNEAVQSIL